MDSARDGALMDIGALTVTTAVLAILAVRSAHKLWMDRGDPRDRSTHVWFAALLTLAAVTCGYTEAAFHHRQQLASEALAVLTDAPNTRANCARVAEEALNLGTFDGYVYFDGSNVAHLRRQICLDIAAYASGGHANPTDEQIQAVHVVAHEAMHIDGYTSESETECRAVQQNHLIAEFLGATPEQARELQRRYFEDAYPRLRQDYTSGECREGGALDMYPDRTEFP